MSLSPRYLLRIALAISCAGALSACSSAGSPDLTDPTTSDCPAATLMRASASRSLVPSGIRASTSGCAHRARIEVPLARVIDLNDDAEVLGERNATGPTELAVWSKAGTRSLAAPSGSVGVSGADLDDAGRVVGCGMYPAGPVDTTITATSRFTATPHIRRQSATAPVCHVVLWSAAGVPTDLGLIDQSALDARAYALSNAGTIVGTLLYADGSQRAFVLLANGTVTYPPVPGARSAAIGVNEQGQVTGWYTNGSAQYGPWRAFTWSLAGGFVDLGVLPSPSGTLPSVRPVAINESGEILGTEYAYSTSTPTTLQRTTSWVWQPSGGMRDVGTPSGMDATVAMNDQGEILGWANLDGMHQPVTWALSRPSLLAVRYGWTYSAAQGEGELHQINNWNEVLDSFNEAGVLHNVVWTWNPERYR